MRRARAGLTSEERAQYGWQIDVEGFGEAGQEKLKASSVLVSRVGGVGGAAALYLAAAGIGRLVLAHKGSVKTSDLNRQVLMTADSVGTSRVASARKRLRELNPRVEVEIFDQNIDAAGAAKLVGKADLVVGAAPLFEERLLANREAVRQGKPLVDAAMFELEAQLTTVVPGKSPCLACLYPVEPPGWKRRFPVFGAVAGLIGSFAALEAIKVLTGMSDPLLGRMLICDFRNMTFRTARLRRNASCAVCGSV
jgi:molybdopterin/thiamine biosynthesis adenylyltransferase